MKTINTIFAIIIGAFFASINAQEIETIATFEVLDGRDNGSDITPQMLEANAYLALYLSSDKEDVMFANVWELNNSQSFGSAYAIVKEEFPETDEDYKGVLFNFNWSYQNSYDDKKGTAKVKLLVIFKPQGAYFEFTIIPEDLDELVYKGVMNGDLSLLDNYLKK